MTTVTLHTVDLDSTPYSGWMNETMEKFGEPFDNFLANLHASGEVSAECRACGKGVGAGMEDDFTDDGHRMRATWEWMTLVTDGQTVWALCETCSLALEAPVQR